MPDPSRKRFFVYSTLHDGVNAQWLLIPLLVAFACPTNQAAEKKIFQAGACAIDTTPQTFPVILNGGFGGRTADQAHDPLHARCLVLDDGVTRVAIVVVDICMMSREFLDETKELAHKATGIPVDRMMISATHTHAGPAVMNCLLSGVDETYRKFLPRQIAKGIELAVKNLAPATMGWTVTAEPNRTFCRRWIVRPDKLLVNPFGDRVDRAMLHPQWQNPDCLGPSGPVDPSISILSVQSPGGRPIAVLTNYSMHYAHVGAMPVSADYFGRFGNKLAQRIDAENVDPPFVGIMSQGTSGDLQNFDFSKPEPAQREHIDSFANGIAQIVSKAYETIEYHDWAPVIMREKKLTLGIRKPNKERLAKAKNTLALSKMKGRTRPRGLEEVYAHEQILLAQMPPTRELKLQALRVGKLGIVAIPNEVFAITGLKIKAQSPLQPTFVIGLANGEEGYIPPPAQHKLGGYTTWPTHTCALETQAEPKITTAVLELLEEVAGKTKKPAYTGPDLAAAYPRTVLDSKPWAYWQLDEFEGPQAIDGSSNKNNGTYEAGIAFYLEGADARSIAGNNHTSRAAHFAGGRINSASKNLNANQYTIEMWFCNYLPASARAGRVYALFDAQSVTGYMFSRGPKCALGAPGDHLGIGAHGTSDTEDRLFFSNGTALNQVLIGKTNLKPKTWNHVAMVRDDSNITIYLNGNTTPEISGQAESGFPPEINDLFVGGRNDGFANFEGRIDEVSIYNRALSANEIAKHYQAAVGFP